MAAPPGKAGALETQERYSTPAVTPPKKKPKGRDKSHPSPAPVVHATKPPDLGAQQSRGPQIVAQPAHIDTHPHAVPIPALQRYGVNMDIRQVNDNVDQIAAAHLAKMGYNPSPGLVFDLLKSNGLLGGQVDYHSLFGVPMSTRDAQAQNLARIGSGDTIATAPVIQPKLGDLVKAVNDAVKKDTDYFNKTGHVTSRESNSSWFAQLMQTNKAEYDVALADPEKRGPLLVALQHAYEKRGQVVLDPSKVYASALGPLSLPSKNNPFGIALKATAQIIQSTADMPFGFYQMAKGLGIDAGTLTDYALQGGTFDWRDLHTVQMGKAMGESVIQDVLHPTDRPGYLIMDIWGAASLGAGAAGKLSAAGRAGGIAATAKALVSRPAPAFTEMRFRTYNANLPLSDTMIVRILQEHTPYVGRVARQKNLQKMATDGYDDLEGVPFVEKINGGTMRTLAKQKKLDQQIEIAAVMTPVVEMQRINRWRGMAQGVLEDFHAGDNRATWRTLVAKQKLGVEKALQVVMTDDPNPLGTWRSFHENEIARLTEAKGEITPAVGQAEAAEILESDRALRAQHRNLDEQINNHQGQLEALQLAESIIRRPPKRLKPLIDRAFEVAAAQEKIKTQMLGLDPAIAEQHIAAIGAKLRGEHIIDLGGGLKGIADAPIDELLQKVERARVKHANANKRYQRAAATDRVKAGHNPEELSSAKMNLAKRERQLGMLEAELVEARATAIPLRSTVKALPKGAKVVDVYHGSTVAFDKLRKDMGEHGSAGLLGKHGVYVTTEPKVAEGYTKFATRGGRGDAPNVRVHQIDESTIFSLDDAPLEPGLFNKVIADLGPAAKYEMQNANIVSRKDFWHALKSALSVQYREAKIENPELRFDASQASDDAAKLLEKNGFTGVRLPSTVEGGDHTLIFDPENAPVKFDPNLDKDVRDLRQGTEGSAYFPTQPQRYRPQRSPARRLASRARYGLSPHKYQFKTWTGTAIEHGDFRYDISNLLAEQMESAYHAAMLHTQWKDLWDAAIQRDTRPSERHMPIRDIADAPEKLKALVAKLETYKLDQKFADLTRGESLRELHKYMYDVEGVDSKHVRWVDQNLILDKMGGMDTQFWRTLDQAVGSVMAPINEPMRIALIFASPAYILNALGAASTLMIKEGILAPANLGRSMSAKHLYGPEVTRLLDRLAGQSHTSSLVSERSLLTKGSQGLQQAWQVLTDTHFRRAAVIHELRREGLLKDAMSNEELYQLLTSGEKGTQAKINRAAQNGRKGMLDFNQMSWPERATLRHMFFVYSFVRASGIWSLRYLRDHGAQAATFAQAGRERENQIKEFVGEMPEWFMRSGYFAVHPGVIYNPIQWNMPGMLEQIATPLSAVFGDTPYASAAELLGPAATVGTEIFTKHDLQGNELPKDPKLFGQDVGNGSFQQSLLGQWQQTPWGRIAVKAQKSKRDEANKTPPPPVRSGFADPIEAALSSERAGIKQSVFENDGFWNTWGQALFRSGITRDVNRAAGEARYWRDLRETDPEKYHRHEMEAVVKMVKRQGQVLGEQVPGEVIRAVDTVAHVSQAIEDWKREHQGEPTPNKQQINLITLDTLVSEGHIKKRDRDQWVKNIKGDITDSEMNATRVDLLNAGGGAAWKAWIDRVNKVDSYASPKFAAAAVSLRNANLGDFSKAAAAPRESKWAYGRQAEKILTHAKELKGVLGDGSEGDALKQAEWQSFVNDNDHPIVIKGVSYPSPFAYEFGSKTPEQQVKSLAVVAQRKFSSLTALQQQLLTGTRPDPIVVKAQATLYGWLKDAKAKLAFGERLTSGTKAYWEDYIASKVPAYKKVLAMDRAPLAKRMATYSVVKRSPFAADWDTLLSTAGKRYDQFSKSYVTEEGKPVQSLIQQAWKQTDVPTVKAWIASRPGFTSELRLYTGATSDKNADQALTNFLTKLISP